ncbi:MAG: hypothetical protein NTY02_17130, partial [Acidobacteria bacterium]|nr:hypothetical protein [Acidobacteriota bacterium]
NTEAIAFEREKEAQRIKEQERYDAEAKLQWEAEQKRLDDELARQTALDNATVEDRRAQFAFAKEQYANRQAQMAPYRQAGAGALAQLATLAGVASPTAAAPKVLTEMPTNWQPGDPVVETAASTQTDVTEATTPAPGASASLLDNPNLLPSRLTAQGTQATVAPVDVTPVAMPATLASVPTQTAAPSVAYQPLAAARPDAVSALTPAQVAMLRKVAVTAPLSDLARARKARV